MTCIYIDFDQLHCSSTPISNMSSTIDIFAAAYVVQCVIFDNGPQFCCLLPIPPPFGRRPTTDSAFQPLSCATTAGTISFEDKTESSPTWKGQKQNKRMLPSNARRGAKAPRGGRRCRPASQKVFHYCPFHCQGLISFRIAPAPGTIPPVVYLPPKGKITKENSKGYA